MKVQCFKELGTWHVGNTPENVCRGVCVCACAHARVCNGTQAYVYEHV